MVINCGFVEDKGRTLISIWVCKNKYINISYIFTHVYKLPRFCHLYTFAYHKFDIVSWASLMVGSCFMYFLHYIISVVTLRMTNGPHDESKGSYNEYRQEIEPDPPVRCVIMNFLWNSCILLTCNFILQAAIRGYHWVSCWRDTSDTLYSRPFCPPYSSSCWAGSPSG